MLLDIPGSTAVGVLEINRPAGLAALVGFRSHTPALASSSSGAPGRWPPVRGRRHRQEGQPRAPVPVPPVPMTGVTGHRTQRPSGQVPPPSSCPRTSSPMDPGGARRWGEVDILALWLFWQILASSRGPLGSWLLLAPGRSTGRMSHRWSWSLSFGRCSSCSPQRGQWARPWPCGCGLAPAVGLWRWLWLWTFGL
jgi:hypothetical protein